LIKYPNGIVYQGKMINNVKIGYGTQNWPDGAIYLG
jgi:hypothetical protein